MAVPSARPRARRRPLVAALFSALALAATAVPAGAAPTAQSFLPVPPHNPYAGPDGTATMHGDTGSSDTTPLAGPGAGALASKRVASPPPAPPSSSAPTATRSSCAPRSSARSRPSTS